MPVAVEQAGNFGAPSKQTKQNNEQRFSESAVPPTRMRARCSWFLKGRPKSRRVPQWRPQLTTHARSCVQQYRSVPWVFVHLEVEVLGRAHQHTGPNKQPLGSVGCSR